MELSEEIRAAIGEAIDSGKVLTPEELLQKFPKHVTLMPDGFIYLNPWVTAELDGASSGEVTHVKIIVLTKQGYFTIIPAQSGEKGAVPFERGDSRRTGTIDARVAVQAFSLVLNEDRKLNLPVIPDTVPTAQGEQKILAIRVKRPKSKKTAVRPRKNSADKETKPGDTQAQAPTQAPAQPQAPTQPQTKSPDAPVDSQAAGDKN
jgi:hypothetical protein